MFRRGIGGEKIDDFISRSRLRQLALLLLGEESKKVSELSSDLDKSLQSTSRTLRELRENGLVRCSTPERRSNRVYKITDEGKRVLEQASTSQGYLRGRRFELKVASALDRARMPYARNRQIDGKTYEHQPDFVIEGSEGLEMVIEAKIVSDRTAISNMKRFAFIAEDLKARIRGLKAVLVVGGTSRESELGQNILKLESQKFFDRIIFEEKLEDSPSVLRELMGGGI